MNSTGELYDKLLPLFRTNRAHAFRYGFWGRNAWTFAQAQENENAFLADFVKLQGHDKVLDAGCGVGGSAFWIAKKIGASVVGIAAGSREIAYANILAVRKKYERPPIFHVMDLCAINLPSTSFDVVWAIESISYVEDKFSSLKDLLSLLRPEGRIVIADLYLTHRPTNDAETHLKQLFALYSRTPPLVTTLEMEEILMRAGYSDISYVDKRLNILPTAFLHWLNYVLALPFVFLLTALTVGRFPPLWVRQYIKMARIQWRGFSSGLFTYGVFVATKNATK
jgi:tocopherol O-methyltransferase